MDWKFDHISTIERDVTIYRLYNTTAGCVTTSPYLLIWSSCCWRCFAPKGDCKPHCSHINRMQLSLYMWEKNGGAHAQEATKVVKMSSVMQILKSGPHWTAVITWPLELTRLTSSFSSLDRIALYFYLLAHQFRTFGTCVKCFRWLCICEHVPSDRWDPRCDWVRNRHHHTGSRRQSSLLYLHSKPSFF